ncbi:GAF domain-containing protein [Umezawaea sp. NPDC059074]|uniref:helix-turn-helix domain-containing protein n=1 Tax=Umezawaea sp. NPDC059074 TaxID=3346716 RepID=UPI00368C4D8C
MHWGHDQRAKARALSRVHDAFLGGGSAGFVPRKLISESWGRSLAAQIDPYRHEAPIVLGPDEVADRWAEHPLSGVLPVLRETLVGIAEDAMHVMIITDGDGHVLWCEGARKVRRSAEDVRLAEGARWTEEAIGTNAMGIALAVDTPVVVHSAEHLVRTYHGWTCAASPVHDPDTGTTIGAVDISGPLHTVHPAMGALVSAAARLAESELRLRQAARDELLRSRNMRHLIALRGEPGALLSPTGRVLAAEPHGLLPARIDPTADRVPLADGREGVLEPLAEGFLLRVARTTAQRHPVLSLTFLGVEHPSAVLNGRELPLTSRHAELLTALVLHPHGLTAEQLALKLYGDRGNPATVRAELHRLRAQVGTGTLLTKPYRLRADVQGDFVAVREALRRGDVGAVAAGYRGALLPRSEAPVVRDEREDLLAGVRRAVLTLGDAESLWEFTRTDGGHDDVEALHLLVRALPRDDIRRELVAGQLRRALRVDG